MNKFETVCCMLQQSGPGWKGVCGDAVSFRCSIEVGQTSYTEDELLELIDHMGIEYSGQRYHLLQTNCNNFSSDLCYALCGKRPPGWTNRLAGVAVALHCLCPSSLVPPLQPPSMCPYGDKGMPARTYDEPVDMC